MMPRSGQGGDRKSGTDSPHSLEITRNEGHFTAIIEDSDDAIITKNLDGIILSWNGGAEAIFGYSADEAIGKPITMLMPPERFDEEPNILARIRRGERITHYETVRRRKDGTDIHISLTVSPLRNRHKEIIGASKIARDITERHLAEDRQRRLLGEMQHRVKNVFALAQSLVSVCVRQAGTPEELAVIVGKRLRALADAHELTVPRSVGTQAPVQQVATLRALLSVLAAPAIGENSERLRMTGEDIRLAAEALTPLALVFYELFSNAAKYGALKGTAGTLDVEWERRGNIIALTWTEHSNVPTTARRLGAGFGTRLIDATINGELAGSIERRWTEGGLVVRLTIDGSRIIEA
jgi:PAS domain S-box-containing protein